MTDLNPTSIRWPLASIDFEASGLGEGTYPIDVGLAVWHGPDTPIRTWSTLIAPTPDRFARGVWKSEAERDRQSVGWGKSVSGRVDLGGRRIIKEHNKSDTT